MAEKNIEKVKVIIKKKEFIITIEVEQTFREKITILHKTENLLIKENNLRQNKSRG